MMIQHSLMSRKMTRILFRSDIKHSFQNPSKLTNKFAR